MKTNTIKWDLLKNKNSLTEEELREELRKYGHRKLSFEELPYIEVDDVEEYARAHGYINQEEYNKWLNNLLK